MNLAKFAIEKRLISALMTLLILAAGYFAYTKLPRFEDPEFLIRQALVITPYSGASAEQVTSEVTDRVENAIQQLQGVKNIKSVSSSGLSEINAEFKIADTKNRAQLNQKFTQLRAKIRDMQNQLPPGAGPTTVYDDFGDVFALYFAISGDGYSLPELHVVAKALQKELVLVDGVSKVQLVGVPEEVVYVEHDPITLYQSGLSSDQIAQVLEGQNLVTAAGSVNAGDSRLVIRPSATLSSLEAIGEVVIADAKGERTFLLKDIATIKRGLKEPASKRLLRDGKPAIGIGISNKIGGNVVNMGDAVNARIDELKSTRPVGVTISTISDQSKSVRSSVNDFVVNVVLALAIVVATLLVFMGLRSGILMGGILLVTVAGTLFGMYIFGLNMQRISLGALIIALGMLVDNAIVVVEGTLVRSQNGEPVGEAARSVVSKTAMPLLGGTVVGLLAFSAIGFSPDNTGEYAGSLFWTITIALLFSWLIAIWLTPYFCTLLLKPSTDGSATATEPALLRGYRKFLETCLKIRWVTVGLIVALFVSAVVAFSYVKPGFFPASTRAQFVVDFTLPEGTNTQRTAKDIGDVESWIRKLEGVSGTSSVVGGGHLRFMLTYSSESANSSYGQILVDVPSYEVISDLIPKIQKHLDATYPDAISKVWKFVLGPGGGSLIEARFEGTDPIKLREISDQAKRIFTNAGAISVKDDWREMVRSVRPIINEQNARRAGLSQADISKAIASIFDGKTIGLFREGEELRQIVMRPLANARSEIERIWEIQVFSSATGRYVPITQVVDDFQFVFVNEKLRRFDRSLAITAQADPRPGVDSDELFNRIRPQIEAIELPDGFRLIWEGQFGDSQQANAGLASTMPFGFGAMVIVVLLLFNAIRQPLIIFLTVPLAIIGVVYGLIFLNTPMEFMAILGVLSLTGMLIKNAIVLIDQMDDEIANGKLRMDAVMDASVSRVRPVCLGVLTTVLGVIPLLWDPFFRSLAVVIICGLSFATILTLIVVPALYAIFFNVQRSETEHVDVELDDVAVSEGEELQQS